VRAPVLQSTLAIGARPYFFSLANQSKPDDPKRTLPVRIDTGGRLRQQTRKHHKKHHKEPNRKIAKGSGFSGWKDYQDCDAKGDAYALRSLRLLHRNHVNPLIQ
jgi:hypothetical protein